MSYSVDKRKVVHSEGRAIIAKVFHFLHQEYKFMKVFNHDHCDLSPLTNVRKRIAEATGISERTVTKILKEEHERAPEEDLSDIDSEFIADLPDESSHRSKNTISYSQ